MKILNFIMAALTVSLCACVPTVTTIYDGPQLSGTVVSIGNLKPLAGAEVYYENSPEDVVLTDEQGRFVLPPSSETKAVMLVPGHAMKSYKAVVKAEGHLNQAIITQGSMLMRSLEYFEQGVIVLDDDPNTLAKPSVEGGRPFNNLRTYLYPHSLFAGCDVKSADSALTALNTYRKLFWQLQDQDPEDHGPLMDYTVAVKGYAADLWYFIRGSCKGDDRGEQHQEIDLILRELDE